jgi:hypothetical protein
MPGQRLACSCLYKYVTIRQTAPFGHGSERLWPGMATAAYGRSSVTISQRQAASA